MKVKTDELSGDALNWAVGQADECDLAPVEYSTNWEFAGPIIEREKIGFRFSGGFGFCAWKSYGVGPHRNEHSQYGPTPLIAAMRCYVANKLGDEVEVPDEFLEGERVHKKVR